MDCAFADTIKKIAPVGKKTGAIELQFNAIAYFWPRWKTIPTEIRMQFSVEPF
jgi:hypothetical protein